MLTLGTGKEPEHKGLGLAFDHAVDHDLIEAQVLTGSGTDAHHLFERFKWNCFLRIVRRVRSYKNGLADGIRGTLHYPQISGKCLYQQRVNATLGPVILLCRSGEMLPAREFVSPALARA